MKKLHNNILKFRRAFVLKKCGQPDVFVLIFRYFLVVLIPLMVPDFLNPAAYRSDLINVVWAVKGVYGFSAFLVLLDIYYLISCVLQMMVDRKNSRKPTQPQSECYALVFWTPQTAESDHLILHRLRATNISIDVDCGKCGHKHILMPITNVGAKFEYTCPGCPTRFQITRIKPNTP